MAEKVGEFFIEMLVDAASGNLSVRQLVSSLGELDVVSLGTVGILTKVGEALANLAMDATNTSVELTALAEITGQDPKIVQQWEKAAERVTHHTGSIVNAIKSVQAMNVGIAAGQGMPAIFSTLGINPYTGKQDAQGQPILKGALDLLREMSASGSKYRTFGPEIQQNMLKQVFGSGGDDMFRVLNSMIAGKFHPEQMPAMNDKQVKSLNQVDADWIRVGQDMKGIFQNMLVAGDSVAHMLENLAGALEKILGWMNSKQGGEVGAGVRGYYSALFSSGGNPLMALLNASQQFGKQYALDHPVAAQRVAVADRAGTQDLRGKLDINITGPGGKRLGQKTAYVDKGVMNADLWAVTDQLGNTP